ncbi:DNA polymerase III subunit delta [Conchiformibius steedae DSM 2580]|uniref:DNA polymerase III subunit delta n=1 Tax=Conchiformibius steedae DSM 2580 TaxID=1121352 RepID=A0AAE9HX44_9NEIS|nr:DNA polymerase III subunit delta [Conchiformibius steedae]QMT32834.1 DNA polymerase III subunit delta [Conchiformibius steedae]URD67445.1 DNA polymerase III subunit delta [Conchiformibius steedae DSM 2580]
MPHAAADRFTAALHAPLQAVYVLHGEEELLRLEALDALRAAAAAQGFHERKRLLAEGTTFDWSALAAERQSTGLFAEKKWLEIHVPSGKVGKNGGDALAEWATHPPDNTATVVVLPKLERAQSQSKWFAVLSKHALTYECKAVTPAQLPAWIRARLQRYGLNAESEAAALIAQRVEGNLLAAKQEIDKLALLYPQGHLLTEAEAADTVADVARFDAFQLAAAWMYGDSTRLMRLLDNLSAAENDPVLPLWALADDIRTLLRLSAAQKQGKSAAALRQELRLWNGKDRAAEAALRRLTPARLTAALIECARTDRQIKGAEAGDAWASFKRLIIGLSA